MDLTNSKLLTHPTGISVELLDSMGNDLAVINAAKVSLGKESSYEQWRINPRTMTFQKREDFDPLHDHMTGFYMGEPILWYGWNQCLSVRDSGILNYMMREKHGSPFEMVVLKFRVHVPIAVGREWMRHRIGSFNEMSTRYVEWEKDFYMPDVGLWRKQIGKVGHYRFVPITDGDEHNISVKYELAMEYAFQRYQELLDLGLAKEVARNILPLGSFTTFIWCVNLRSLFNFVSLRTHETALKEIQIPARMVESLAETVVPESMNAWRRHGKHTP